MSARCSISSDTKHQPADRLAAKESPFADVPRAMRRGVHWVRPKLVAQVAFSTWTRDNLVRKAAHKGLREDKPATEVVRERFISLTEPESDSSKRVQWQH